MYLCYFILTNASALKRLRTKIKYLKYNDHFIDNMIVGRGIWIFIFLISSLKLKLKWNVMWNKNLKKKSDVKFFLVGHIYIYIYIFTQYYTT